MFNSVVKECCFKHLEDVITMSVCDVPVPFYHNQVRPQCLFSLGTRLLHNGKEKFYYVLLN